MICSKALTYRTLTPHRPTRTLPSLLLPLTLLAALAGCDAQRQTNATPPKNAHKTWIIPDPAFDMPAAQATLPAGWEFAGVAVHASNCVVTGHSIVYNAQSQDGLTGYGLLPALRAQYVNDPRTMAQYRSQGCLVAPSMSAADFIKVLILPRLRPGAQVVSVGEEPRLVPALQAAHQQIMSMGTMRGLQMQADAKRVKIVYQRHGKAVEEYVSAMVSCTRSNQQYPGMPPMLSVDCTADPILTVRAPEGQLEAMAQHPDLIQFTINPAWQQRLSQVQANEGRQEQQAIIANGQQQMAKTKAQTQQTIDNIHRTGAISMQHAAQVQNGIDQSAGAFALHMGDKNNYTNPSTGETYQLSNQYKTTYQNANGDVLQTNSAYAPGPSSWWTELQPQ